MEVVSAPSIESPDLVQYRLGNAAVVGTGFFRGWHVTDDVERLVTAVRRHRNILAPEHEHRELGPGFYVSAVPGYWSGRSGRKWEPLRNLSATQVRQVASALRQDSKLFRHGYLTEPERERALRLLQNWEDGDEYGILEVAGQPYNLDVFGTLRRLGIRTYEPHEADVVFTGRYVSLGRRLALGEWKTLRAQGFDGAFNKAGMSVNPELAIWNVERIQSIDGR